MQVSKRYCCARAVVGADFVSRSRRGSSFNSGASTSKLFFDPDLNGGSQSKTITGNPPVASGSMPTPSSYQLSQTFTSASSSATAKGSLGYVSNATTATFTLAAGTGVAQVDASNVYTGASQVKIDFDGFFNPTAPSFGPVAMGYVLAYHRWSGRHRRLCVLQRRDRFPERQHQRTASSEGDIWCDHLFNCWRLQQALHRQRTAGRRHDPGRHARARKGLLRVPRVQRRRTQRHVADQCGYRHRAPDRDVVPNAAGNWNDPAVWAHPPPRSSTIPPAPSPPFPTASG